jgi:hypothetical protein
VGCVCRESDSFQDDVQSEQGTLHGPWKNIAEPQAHNVTQSAAHTLSSKRFAAPAIISVTAGTAWQAGHHCKAAAQPDQSANLQYEPMSSKPYYQTHPRGHYDAASATMHFHASTGTYARAEPIVKLKQEADVQRQADCNTNGWV